MSISAPFIKKTGRDNRCDRGGGTRGAVAYRFLPVSPLPQVDFPTINVSASPGRKPRDHGLSVATPLERQFGRIAGVTEMTSSSPSARLPLFCIRLKSNIDAAARTSRLRSTPPGATAKQSAKQSYLQESRSRDAPNPDACLDFRPSRKDRMYDIASSILQQKLSE